MRRFFQLFILLFLPLLLSLLLYVFFRPPNVVINVLLEQFFPDLSISHWRGYLQNSIALPPYIVYTLPAMLWIFSITSLATSVFVQHPKVGRWLLPLPMLYGIGLELCQYVGLTDGTFDWWDFWSAPVAALIGFFIGKIIFSKQKMPFSIAIAVVVLGFLSLYMGDTWG